MLKRLGGAALLGALAYTTADAAADSALYWRARGLVMEQAVAHERLCRELGGPPLQAGPWYNSSVAISHDGHIATVTMPLRGNRRSSDVTVRVVRQGGLRSTLLYNLVGGGHWDVLVMNALVGMGPGGTPISLSLMQQAPPNAAAASPAAVSHAEALAAAHQARLLAAEQHAADAVAARQSTRREQ
ncbi:hypothetical protein D9Q98_007278 [Chlorella vulgaris]|uniref:Uncharacterized protein n=1 Tax=Chlorella vulgaris TaxID=3077 RepID=A0A9D4TKV4_CHLVU|nr:hypothetical protein D9Q98_007278 [Chlorella vulgaris]